MFEPSSIRMNVSAYKKIKLVGTPWKQGLKCAQHVSIQASDILMMKHAAGINNYIYNKYSACMIKNRNIQRMVL